MLLQARTYLLLGTPIHPLSCLPPHVHPNLPINDDQADNPLVCLTALTHAFKLAGWQLRKRVHGQGYGQKALQALYLTL